MLQYIFIVATITLGWAYIRWTQVNQFWAKRGVVHLKMHPIYGSLDFLSKENPAIWMRNLYKRYKTPYVGIWLFWRPALVINSPEIAKRVLVKDFEFFRNRLAGTGIQSKDPTGGLNLFAVNDPIWSSLRRRLTPGFTLSKLRSLHGLTITKSEELTQRIQNELAHNKPPELRSLFADYTTDIIGISAFGVDSNSTLTGESHMRTVTKDFMKFSIVRGWAWISIFFFPELVNIFRFSFFPKNAVRYFQKVFKTVVAQRGGYAGKRDHHDILDMLMKMKHEADLNGENMDEDIVLAQAIILLQGGFDTSAVTLTYIMYEMAFQPEAQERLYNELLQAKQKNENKEIDGSTLSELPFLNAVIKEVLRKYPAMGWLDRTADKDYQIDEKLTIPAGTSIYVNAVGMHYDPEYFPNPDEFIPERFLPETGQDIKPFTYMPFGEGPRNCIGMRFAYRTMWYAVAAIFLKYKIRPKPNARRPNDIPVEKRSMFAAPGEAMYVEFIPRK